MILYSASLKTSKWDHKFLRTVFSEVMDQGTQMKFSQRLVAGLLFANSPPGGHLQEYKFQTFHACLTFQTPFFVYIWCACCMVCFLHRSANITITRRKEDKNKNIKTSRASFEHFQHYIFMCILFRFFVQFHYLFKYVSRPNYFFHCSVWINVCLAVRDKTVPRCWL